MSASPSLVPITIDELKAKGFCIMTVKDYGRCIIVPGAEFNPDWELSLTEQGYKCINDTLDNQPVTFVQLKNEPKRKGIGKKRGGNQRGHNWTEPEDQKIKELMAAASVKHKTYHDQANSILAEFPGRTICSLVQHYRQITTSQERTIARVNALDPKVVKDLWKPADEKTEKYTLTRDGMNCTAMVTSEKGVISRVSAVIEPTEANSHRQALVVRDLPAEAINILHELVEQLQEAST